MTTRVSYNLQDALLIKQCNFPSAAGTVTTESLDLGSIADRGVRIDPFELLVIAPEAAIAELPADTSNTFSLQFCDTPEFTAGVLEWSAGTAWQQAGSANGSAAFERRFRPATDALRYVRAKCVTAGSAVQTGKSFQLVIVT